MEGGVGRGWRGLLIHWFDGGLGGIRCRRGVPLKSIDAEATAPTPLGWLRETRCQAEHVVAAVTVVAEEHLLLLE